MRLAALHFIALFIHCALAKNSKQDYKMYTSRPDCSLSDNKGLQGNTTNTVRAENEANCARKCNADVKCASFNYNSKNHTCQLNWGLAGENCEALTDMPQYKYYQQQVDKRCSYHGVRINEACGCRCEMPYFGKLCEKKYQENIVPRPHGNPPLKYTGTLGSYLNLLTGMPFPQDGTVVGWVYYMVTGRPFVGIYRPVGDDLFRLLYKTELPYTGTDKHSYLMECPWHVQQGDIIGLHAVPGRYNSIRICVENNHWNTDACAYGTYGSYSVDDTLSDDALKEGNNYTLKKSNQPRKYAVQALFF